MIYIFTALPCEAKPFITFLNLKRENNKTVWAKFINEERDITLVITGTGPVAAAASVSSVLSGMDGNEVNFVINIGTCCRPGMTEDEFGGLFLINKLTDSGTGRDFYPDILNICMLPEASLFSVAIPVMADDLKERYDHLENKELILYDMEGAYIYQTVRYYLGPSRVSFLKLVSDSGLDSGKIQFNELGEKIEAAFIGKMEIFGKYIEAIREKAGRISAQGQLLRDRIDKSCDYDKLVEDLHATAAMGNRLRQLIRFSACAGICFNEIICEMYSDGSLPVKNKKEGLAVLNRLSELTVNYY